MAQLTLYNLRQFRYDPETHDWACFQLLLFQCLFDQSVVWMCDIPLVITTDDSINA